MSTAEALNAFTLTLERRFSAPIDKVFDAFLRKEALEQWFSPAPEIPITVLEIDARVGGRYSMRIQDDDCDASIVSGEYVSIERPHQLVFTWAWEVNPDAVSLVTISMRSEGDATLLTLLHEKLPDARARDLHGEGWSGCLARLGDLLAGG